MMPISLASFLGPIIFGSFFDTIGRRKMMFTSYFTSGIMLIGMAILFN
jgi:MFS family permease